MYSLLEIVKPSHLHALRVSLDSNLGTPEKGFVVKCLIDFSKENDDTWKPFTFEQYKKYCAPRSVSQKEELDLDCLVKSNAILDKNNGLYSVNEMFFRKLEQFIGIT